MNLKYILLGVAALFVPTYMAKKEGVNLPLGLALILLGVFCLTYIRSRNNHEWETLLFENARILAFMTAFALHTSGHFPSEFTTVIVLIIFAVSQWVNEVDTPPKAALNKLTSLLDQSLSKPNKPNK